LIADGIAVEIGGSATCILPGARTQAGRFTAGGADGLVGVNGAGRLKNAQNDQEQNRNHKGKFDNTLSLWTKSFK
jgi:hypothetical protein